MWNPFRKKEKTFGDLLPPLSPVGGMQIGQGRPAGLIGLLDKNVKRTNLLLHVDLITEDGLQKIEVHTAMGIFTNLVMMAETAAKIEPILQKIRLAQREHTRHLNNLSLSRKDNPMLDGEDDNTGAAGGEQAAPAGGDDAAVE